MLDHAGPAPGAPAFAEWVNARSDVLQRFCYLAIGDAARARAVLERVLATMHPQWRELADLGDLEIILRQEILRETLREQASRRRPAGPGADGAPGAPGTDPDPGGPGADQPLGLVWRACREMSLEVRAALVLRYAEQMDVVDIADVLDRDQDAVRDLVGSGLTSVTTAVRTGPGGATPHRDEAVDAEWLLRSTFGDYASRSPAVDDLAGRIVRGTRRRRRRTATVGVLGVLAVLVPLAWLASPDPAGGRSADQPAQQQGGPSAPAPASGVPLAALPDMRWESYGGIQVQVPEGWEYGDLTQWCAPDDARGSVEGPAVDRPGSGSTLVCAANSSTGTRGVQRPTYTAGLLLRPADEGPRIGRADVANGAPVYRRRFGGVDLTVIDVDRALAERILTSAVLVYRTDVNGCRTHVDVPSMGRLLALSSIGIEGVAARLRHSDVAVSMSICHYESEPWGRPTLVFSERLGRDAAARMAAALESAPRTAARLPPEVPPRCVESETALLRFAAGGAPTDAWVHYAGCGPHGVDDGVGPRRLTAEVLRPVLDPPWRSTVGAGVPWPPAPADPTAAAGPAE